MVFSSLKIGSRLAVGFGVMVLLMLGIAFTGIHSISGSKDAIRSITQDRYPQIVRATELQVTINEQARILRNLIISAKDAEKSKEWLSQIDEKSKHGGEIIDRLKADMTHPKALELLNDLIVKREAYAKARADLMSFLAIGKVEEAGVYIFDDFQKPQDDYFAAVAAFTAYQEELMKDDGQRADGAADLAMKLAIAISVAGVLVAVGAAYVVAKSIVLPLNRAVKISESVSSGDLTADIQTHGQDETAVLLRALQSMQAGLAKVVSNVRANSERVSTAAAEIAQGNNDLSMRTEQQASSLEQTASSMEELSATVKQNADAASQANQLAQSASAIASQGGQVVSDVVETMRGINDASRKISEIIGVIDGIAFQTNILALNAAVEAARAGEQGRGFAVVASEVRSLAGRSAEAAKEIKTLINANVERVERGTDLVDKAGGTMAEVVNSIRRVTDIIGEINAASAEQAAGVTEVGVAVEDMDKVTQQNAALVEQMASAADGLKSQALDLVQAVASFKLNDSPGQGSRRVPPHPTARTVAAAPVNAPVPHLPKKASAPAALPKPVASSKKTAVGGADDQWEAF